MRMVLVDSPPRRQDVSLLYSYHFRIPAQASTIYSNAVSGHKPLIMPTPDVQVAFSTGPQSAVKNQWEETALRNTSQRWGVPHIERHPRPAGAMMLSRGE